MKQSQRQANKRLSVLIISPFYRPNIGGVEVHLDDLCKYLLKRGHKVFVLTYQPLTEKIKAPSLERKGDLEIHRMKWFGYNWFPKLEPHPLLELFYLFPGLFMYSFLFLLSNRRKIDVVHTHGFVSSFIGVFLKFFYKVRCVASIHTTYSLFLGRSPWLGRVFIWILNLHNAVLLVSEGCKKELLPFGLDPRKVRVFTYWADQDFFKPLDKLECKKRVNWDNKFVILFIARLIRIKGARILIKTAKIVDKDIFFAFVVTGTYKDFLEIAEESELPANAIYVGAVDHSALNLFYNAADILAVPSQYAEGFARVNLEAMLCGTPIIASNIGFLSEVITPYVGELVYPPTPKNFAERIDYYYRNRDNLRRLSESCLKYARERFSDANAKIIEESYY